MDFPKSQEWVGLVDDRFANPDMEQGREGSKVPAEYLNALGEEIGHVVEAQGHVLEEGNNGQLNQALREAMNQLIPLGTVLPVASHLTGNDEIPASGEVSPQGFMQCDGAEIPAGNRLQGRVPDLTEGRFLRGSTVAGGTGGSESFTLNPNHLPPHTHSMDHTHTATSGTAGAHAHRTSGGIQGLEWKPPKLGAFYFQHFGYPSNNFTYEYRTQRGHRTLAGWEYTHYTWGEEEVPDPSNQDQERTRTDRYHIYHFRRKVPRPSLPHKYQLTNGTFSVQSGGGHSHPLTINSHEGQSGSVGARAAKVHLPKYFNVQYLIKVN